MFTEKEGTFDVGGKSLYTKSWVPKSAPKAKVVFFHGYSDHVGRYQAMSEALARRGIAVYGFDQRGWGRSVAKPSEKGLTGPTSQVVADMAAFVKQHLPASAADPPVFVLGHSMGGGQALMLACDPAYQDDVVRPVRGWLLESPFIGFAPENNPGSLKVMVSRVVARVMPHRQMLNRLPPETLSQDPAVVKSIAEDELMHNTGTLEGLSGLLDRVTSLSSGAVRPTGTALRSLWVGHGTLDKATDFDSSKRYFEKYCDAVPDKEFKVYEGWFHQLHADGPHSEEYFNDVAEWILARCGEDDAAKPDSKL